MVVLVTTRVFCWLYNAGTAGRREPPPGLSFIRTGDYLTRSRSWGTTGSPIVLVHGAFESAAQGFAFRPAPVSALVAGSACGDQDARLETEPAAARPLGIWLSPPLSGCFRGVSRALLTRETCIPIL